MPASCRPIRRRRREAFCDGHVVGFEFFGGVPLSILYDNTKLAVARILGDGTRLADASRSASCSRITCSPIGSAALARATTRARSKGLVGLCAAQLHGAAATCRQLRCAERAVTGGLPPPPRTIGCAAMTRRSASGWRGTASAFTTLPAAPYDACEKQAAPGQLAVTGALPRHRLLGADRLRPSRGADPRLRRRQW